MAIENLTDQKKNRPHGLAVGDGHIDENREGKRGGQGPRRLRWRRISILDMFWEEPIWERTSVGIRGWLSTSKYVVKWVDGRW
jgi:hypothetical protein